MAAKRVIPCLDVKGGRVVKGVQFRDLRDLGSPAELARRYDREGADEVVFLDIAATEESRATQQAWVREVARELTIPFSVGGGVRELNDFQRLLRAGADKIAINTSAVARPELIDESARAFGQQCVIVAVDVARDAELGWRVFVNGGKQKTPLRAVDWLREVTDRGAGEVLLTSIDRDGTGDGFDVDLLREAATLPIPVIASGGAGRPIHFADAISAGAEAVLAATLFHERTLSISELKRFLHDHGIEVRLP